MSSSDKLEQQKNKLEDESKMFGSTWVWGFIIGWAAIVLAVICFFIVKKTPTYPVFIFFIIFFYLIFINMFKALGFMRNSTYGKTALVALILSIVEVVIGLLSRIF